MLKISPYAASCAQNAILITGSARSGTTLMGQIVSSLEGVEYTYEPPMLFAIFALIGDLSEHQWRLLYETYLYEEFLMNVLAGRCFNLNRLDNSSVFKTKPMEEIERRLRLDLPKAQAERLALGSTVAYKMPDVVPMVPAVKAYYPETRVVVMLREAVGTINSVLQRKWFSDESASKSLIWPFRIYNNDRVPFWVKPEDVEYWTTISELDKAAYYYIRVNEDVENISGRIEVGYDRMLLKPKEVIAELIDKLGVKSGPKTDEVVAGIRKTEKDRDLQLIGRINSDLRERVKQYSDRSLSI